MTTEIEHPVSRHYREMREFVEEQLRISRRPHYDPKLARLGVVLPKHEDEHAAFRGQAFFRSWMPGGASLPPLLFLWVNDTEYIMGATPTLRAPGMVPVVLRAGRSFEEIFLTTIHECRHAADAVDPHMTSEERERRADRAMEEARRLRGMW